VRYAKIERKKVRFDFVRHLRWVVDYLRRDSISTIPFNRRDRILAPRPNKH